MGIRIGYKASAEQFAPRELLEFTKRPPRPRGFDIVARLRPLPAVAAPRGHSPAALPWLGAAGQRDVERRWARACSPRRCATTRRSSPRPSPRWGACAPGRVFLGVGTGEAMNETPATGGEFPGRKERRMRLAEAIALIRRLWSEERVDFEGEYYGRRRRRSTTGPMSRSPIYVAASGPLAAKLAGRVGDGFICTSGKDPSCTASCWRRWVRAPTAAGRDAGDDPPDDRDQGLLQPRSRFGLRRPARGGRRWR